LFLEVKPYMTIHGIKIQMMNDEMVEKEMALTISVIRIGASKMEYIVEAVAQNLQIATKMVNGVQPNFALTEYHETMVKVFMSLQ
jgi:hypothetical protein